VPGGINVHGLMDCLLKHFQFGPEYTVVSEYGGDASGDIAAAITPLPTWTLRKSHLKTSNNLVRHSGGPELRQRQHM